MQENSNNKPRKEAYFFDHPAFIETQSHEKPNDAGCYGMKKSCSDKPHISGDDTFPQKTGRKRIHQKESILQSGKAQSGGYKINHRVNRLVHGFSS